MTVAAVERWDDAFYRAEREWVLATSTHCWLCGSALTSHRWPHPLSSTVDHRTSRFVARRLGWSWRRINDRSNLAAAHKVCNERRQAGDSSVLRLPPSPWD